VLTAEHIPLLAKLAKEGWLRIDKSPRKATEAPQMGWRSDANLQNALRGVTLSDPPSRSFSERSHFDHASPLLCKEGNVLVL